MRVLVVGAGAIGAYFGARLLEAGVDTTFLVRPARQAQLRQALSVRSPKGDVRVAAPPTVTADHLSGGFDLVLVSCKAYDLGGAIDSFAPAVGADTAILPLLNGMRHLEDLRSRFGAPRVLGGQCQIAATLSSDGGVIHLNDTHQLAFGELDGARTARVQAIQAAFSGAKFDGRLSDEILQEMWEKWVFIAALAGSTCLMRASVGEIVRSGSAPLQTRLLQECAAIAGGRGHAPRAQALARAEAVLTDAASSLTASMLRDLERGARSEADHVIGDLLARRGDAPAQPSLLDVAYAHLKAYEQRRTSRPA
jgi:2-dehydropantoate 2-reductase